MKHLYIVRRHRLAPLTYQGKFRKVPVYGKEYEVLFATDDVGLANNRRKELETNNRHAYKYAIARLKVSKIGD